MPFIAACFGCGLVFGAGLLISGMTQPEKVLGFLDIFGAWDATLIFVMGAAVAVATAGFALARRRGSPLLATKYLWPTRRDLDIPLVSGAVMFGVGWGLVGICPGPALVDLAGLGLPIMVFVVTMAIGMFGYELLPARGLSPGVVENSGIPSRADG